MGSLLSDLAQYRLLIQLIFVLGIGGTFHHGFHIAVINAPSLYIKSFINDTWQKRYNSTMDEKTLTVLWSSVVSFYSVGGLLGSLMTEYLTGKYGKMKCQLWNNVLVLAAALLMGFCRMADSFEMILIGRLLYGFSAGFGLNIHMQYLGEIAPKRLRGLTNSTATIFATVGKLVGQILGLSEILGTKSWWPLLLAITSITALIQLVTLPCFPETPAYLLIQKEDTESCRKVMKQLWGNKDHQEELADLLKEKDLRKTKSQMTPLDLLRDRSLRWQQYLMLTMIYFYSYDVFHTAGFSLEEIPYLTLGIGASETIATVLCWSLIERMGRKTLLLCGYGLMAFSLGLLTVTLSLKDYYSWIPYCSLGLIFLYILFFGSGTGASVAIISEIFTQSSRAAAFVFIGSFTWVGIYLIAMIFPFIVESMGQYCFLIFLSCIVSSWIVIFLFLPETKAKSSLEIMMEFNKLNFGSEHIRSTSENPHEASEKCSRL
ncbi:solute carrier family 2, facilitated glucose transporter member 11 isoform X2 [Microcaecilia unicolor]|uniref:Solute carrier family 2, facilitated glucose transporter member 5 n=1 Tax=Microcaecilia unicolor TaxID=1415580 RepID=A0A6P7ZJ94_9AMPH|nr:solute carrier family 2, facilitated glucose transporter member 11-like isoform X2 [Microcaecilia unicolor]